MEKIFEFFLGSVKYNNDFARMKHRFLFGIMLCGIIVHIIYTLDHYFLRHRGNWFLLGDLLGLLGLLISIFLLTRNKAFEAAISLIIGISCTIVINNIWGDYYKHNVFLSYANLYISSTEVLFLGLVSVLFISKKEVFLVFGALGSFIILAHFWALQSNPNTYLVDSFTPYSYLIGMLGMVKTLAAIGYFILAYMDKVETANIESEKAIKQHSEILEATVEARTRALQESNQSLREFAYVVSHDLKEPLRTVNGFVSLARKSVANNNKNATDIDLLLEHALRGTEQMELLIKDILEYSRLSNILPDMDSIPMQEVFKKVNERLSGTIKETNAVIVIDNIPNVIGEKVLITQLFQNLLSNAIKYRHPERTPEIRIGVVEKNGVKEIFVKDNGIGISQKNYETIFEAFKRLHSSSSKYEGTGIGLAICKKITAIHGGSIRVESVESVGSTFFVALSMT